MNRIALAVCAAAALAASGVAVAESEFAASAWRGETAYVGIPDGLAEKMLPFADKTKDGVTITLLRFDEVAYDQTVRDGKKNKKTGRGKSPDVCRTWKASDVQPPTMVRIDVDPGAKGGMRQFGPLSLKVVNRVLPQPKDWKYFLDLWQHPWAVSRYFKVEPFSKEHYKKMLPIWKALADCGCKSLTVTLLDKPWNGQCYDPYHSMIGRVKTSGGKWKFDYKLFDEYVYFGRKCGLGPDIACYSMCPWGYKVAWQDESGKWQSAKAEPGTPEFEDYWGDFLVDFAKHLKEKGWSADTYIAMDERSPKDVKLIADFVQKKAPGMKIAMCGNRSPSEFKGITIDNFCLGLIHLRKRPEFLSELEPRRKKGYKTTFYVCATAMQPNTFMDSPSEEGFWLGAYPAVVGFDGFLRWAANSWPKNPYKDASFKTSAWRPGDTYLVYPEGELSRRVIALRGGVVAAEKLRILREAGVDVSKALNGLAEKYGYRDACAGKADFAAFLRDLDGIVNR